MQTVNVKLNLNQIDLLRGVLYEYYSKFIYLCETEKSIHDQIETILENAENDLCEQIE